MDSLLSEFNVAYRMSQKESRMQYALKLVVFSFLVILLLPEKEFELVSQLVKNLLGRVVSRSETLVYSPEKSKDSLSVDKPLEPITLQKVKNAIDDANIKFKWVVLAQAVHETDNFNSNIFKQNKNCFGMKVSQRGYALKEKNGHAAYSDVKESILDYGAYQRCILHLASKRGLKIETEEQYLWLLNNLPFGPNSRYAEDKEYTQRVRFHMEKLKKSVSW